MSSCSPSVKNPRLTCYSKEDLETIAKEYNKYYSDEKINCRGKNKAQLWHEIKKKLSNQCNQEWCWIDQNFINRSKARKIAKSTFRPKMPENWKKNKYAWLATDDINNVMEQYENQYPDFIFLGAVPIDCQTLSFCQLYRFNLPKLYRNGIKRIGIVFNLDYHYQSGSHWVAVFIDLKDHCDITFYDSYGKKPYKLIDNFMNKVYQDCQKIPELKGKVTMDYNKKRHQYGYSECGIYSQHYLIQRLKGKSLKQATNKKIPDKVMNEMRKYLYRNTNSYTNVKKTIAKKTTSKKTTAKKTIAKKKPSKK